VIITLLSNRLVNFGGRQETANAGAFPQVFTVTATW